MKVIKLTISRLIKATLLTISILVAIDAYCIYRFTRQGVSSVNNIVLAYLDGRDSVLSLAIFILLPIAFSWVYYSDCKRNYIKYISTRINHKRYRFIVLVTICFMVFITVLIKERLAYYLTLNMLKQNKLVENDLSGYHFVDLMINNPYLYCLLYGIWQAFIHSIYVSFAVIISFYTRSFFIISTAPVLYRYLVDLIATLLPTYPVGSMIYAQGFNSFHGAYSTIPVIILNVSIFVVVQIILYINSSKKLEKLE